MQRFCYDSGFVIDVNGIYFIHALIIAYNERTPYTSPDEHIKIQNNHLLDVLTSDWTQDNAQGMYETNLKINTPNPELGCWLQSKAIRR